MCLYRAILHYVLPNCLLLQRWEYVPLGPFGSKNFCTSISPWVVTMAALAPFKAHTSSGPVQDPQPLPYLQDDDYFSYDINLAVSVQVSHATTTCICTQLEVHHKCCYQRVQLASQYVEHNAVC
jgi:fumarylacetoacetase